MRFLHLYLDNWRNFLHVDVALQERIFLVGANASGKSNFLDAIRFLRDIARPEGGLQAAVNDKRRGGVSQLRCLHARQRSSITVAVKIDLGDSRWGYRLEFSQDSRRRPKVLAEVVTRDDRVVLQRPCAEDRSDPELLTQTHLEQVGANKAFRDIADFMGKVRYYHIIPQLVRETDRVLPKRDDPFGADFLEQIARAPERTRNARLKKINKALRTAVPQLRELSLQPDKRGVPHLKARYEHWRPNAGWQSEEHFSDGTLRLIGLLWAFLDGREPLLLEEPELSLNAGIVRHLAPLLGGRDFRQILVSTHTRELLQDEGIAPEEVLLLVPSEQGTSVMPAADDIQIQAMLEGGTSIADAVMPLVEPADAHQLELFAK